MQARREALSFDLGLSIYKIQRNCYQQSDTGMILQASHTHLYPGNRGTISGLARAADLQSGSDCLLEFSDGSAAAARITKSGSEWRLSTSAYRTAAGTDIPEKSWIFRLREAGEGIEFRVLARA